MSLDQKRRLEEWLFHRQQEGQKRKKEEKRKEVINRDSELEKDKLTCPRGRLDRHVNSWSAEVALVCRVGKMEKNWTAGR